MRRHVCLSPTRRGLLVGLTGGMATGKSTVAALWRQQGAVVLSSDETVHRLLADDPDVRRETLEFFGDGILDEGGRISRSALGRIVFRDEAARQRLMAILHPRTRAHHLREAENHLRDHRIVVLDSPLLFEAGLDAAMDATVTVAASHATQIERALRRAQESGQPFDPDEAERRIALQMPLEEKCRRSTYVLWNDGTPEELARRASQLWKTLCARASQG